MYVFNELQKEWLAALRSGKYKQGQKCLAYSNGAEVPDTRHCCLGVACELSLGKLVFKREDKGAIHFDGESAYLPIGLSSALHLRDEKGTFEHAILCNGMASYSIADLNDKGWSFEQIADYIQYHPENVFTK